MCVQQDQKLRLLSHSSWPSFHIQVKQLVDVLASCELGEMVQLGGESGYCISAETAGIRCTTHGPPNFLVLMLEYSASLVTQCHGSVSHELHCWLLSNINAEALTLPVGCTCVSYSVVQNSSRGFLLSFKFSWVGFSHLAILNAIRPETFPSVLFQFTFVYSFIVYNWETESVFNKIHLWHTARAKEDSRRPFELDAQVRQNFSPVGTLLNIVALG